MGHNATINGLIAALEHDYPSHQVWVVPRYLDADAWCARPWGSEDTGLVINTNSEPELRQALQQATHPSEGEQ
jgi:hypothetical protein